MPGKVNVLGLGTKGVNIVKSPIEMDDNELRQCQNGEPSKDLGFPGLKKRDGLIAHSISTLGDSPVRGGMGLPLPPPGDNGLAPIFVATNAGTGLDLPFTATEANAVSSGSLLSVAFGAGLWVAVGSAGLIRTSPTGATGSWTVRTSPSANDWACVTWNGTVFVAVGTGAGFRTMKSTDGITWAAVTSSDETANWKGVVWASSLNLFVAVASSGTNRVMTSPTGAVWTARSAATAEAWTTVVWSSTLTLLVAQAAFGSTTSIMTSPDGVTWTSRATLANWRAALTGLSTMAWLSTGAVFASIVLNTTNSTYIAITSPDGITWTARTIPNNTEAPSNIIAAPALGIFVALKGCYPNVGNPMSYLTSSDGITWTETDVTAITDVFQWYAIGWDDTNGILLSLDNNSVYKTLILTATTRTAAEWLETTDSGLSWVVTTQLSRRISTTNHRAVRSSAGATLYLGYTAGQVLAWNGQNEYLLTNLPSPSASAVVTASLLTVNGDYAYAVADDGTTQRCYEIDVATGNAVKIGADLTLATDRIVAGCWYLGRLWVASTNGTSDVTKASHIYSVRPGLETAWTTEDTSTIATGANYFQYTDLGPLGGKLYVGASATGAASKIRQRDASGTWSFVFTGPDNNAADVSTFSGFRLVPITGALVVAYYDARSGVDHTGTFYATIDGVTWTSELNWLGQGGTGPMLAMWAQGFSVYATTALRIFKRNGDTGAWSVVDSDSTLAVGTIVAE